MKRKITMINEKVDVNDIMIAKEIARRNGYDVTLPDSKVDIAKNIAKAAGYKVQEPGDIANALEIATKAGYTVSRPNQPAPATPEHRHDRPATSATPAPEQKKSQEDINFDRYLQAAASYL